MNGKKHGTIRVPNQNEVDSSIPSVAIDLSGAYSAPAPLGTGYAQTQWRHVAMMAQDVTQTQAVDLTLAYFNQVRVAGAIRVNLILEAPLCWAFSDQDAESRLNANVRSVERRSNYANDLCDSKHDRPWTVNAGASTSLMALLFLKDLAGQIPHGLTVNLFEGFWSWLNKLRRHHAVASALLEGLQAGGKRIVTLPTTQAIRYQTALRFLQISTTPATHANRPPLIIFGHHNLADAYQRQP